MAVPRVQFANAETARPDRYHFPVSWLAAIFKADVWTARVSASRNLFLGLAGPPSDGPHGTDLLRRMEGISHQPTGVQLHQPLAFLHIALAAPICSWRKS